MSRIKTFLFFRKKIFSTKKTFPSPTQELSQIRTLENHIKEAKLAESKSPPDHRQIAFYYKQAHTIACADTNLNLHHIKHTALSGKVIEAHKMVFDILQKNSADCLAILVRGICFYLEDNTEKALNHFTQALRLAPDLAEAKVYRTKCKELQKIKERGNACFKSSDFLNAIEVYWGRSRKIFSKKSNFFRFYQFFRTPPPIPKPSTSTPPTKSPTPNSTSTVPWPAPKSKNQTPTPSKPETSKSSLTVTKPSTSTQLMSKLTVVAGTLISLSVNTTKRLEILRKF